MALAAADYHHGDNGIHQSSPQNHPTSFKIHANYSGHTVFNSINQVHMMHVYILTFNIANSKCSAGYSKVDHSIHVPTLRHAAIEDS